MCSRVPERGSVELPEFDGEEPVEGVLELDAAIMAAPLRAIAAGFAEKRPQRPAHHVA